jgi:hypothetical protein
MVAEPVASEKLFPLSITPCSMAQGLFILSTRAISFTFASFLEIL